MTVCSDRPWYRLHASSYLVLLLTLGFMTLINWPGNRRCWVESIGGSFQLSNGIEHGWPATYLRRSDQVEDQAAIYGLRSSSLWSLNDSVPHYFSWWPLVANVLIALGFGIAAAIIAEVRGRRGGAILRWSLSLVLTVVGVISLFFGYLAWNAYQHRAEARTEKEIGSNERENFGYGTWQMFAVDQEPRGWSWLEELIGSGRPGIFDRVAEAQGIPPDALHLTSQFKYLRKLSVFVPLDRDTGLRLGDLRRLEALDIRFLRPHEGPASRSAVELNYQRRISDVLRSLGDLPSLRFVAINSDVPFGDALADLRGLDQLEVLVIFSFEMTDDDLANLPELGSVKEIYLIGDRITNRGVRMIGRMRNVQTLALTSDQIDDRSLRYIAQLENLERLWLTGTIVKGQELQVLKPLKHLQALSLNERHADLKTAAEVLPDVEIYDH